MITSNQTVYESHYLCNINIHGVPKNPMDVNDAPQLLGYILRNLLLSSFGTTWGRVNDDRINNFGELSL